MLTYGDIFEELKERVDAFRLYTEYADLDLSDENNTFDEQLSVIYGFLDAKVERDFIEFCAKKNGMKFDKYCDMLGIELMF